MARAACATIASRAPDSENSLGSGSSKENNRRPGCPFGPDPNNRKKSIMIKLKESVTSRIAVGAKIGG